MNTTTTPEIILTADSPHWNDYANDGVSPGDEYTHVVVCEGPEDEDEARELGVFRAIRQAAKQAGLKSSTWDIRRAGDAWVMGDCWVK